MKTLFADYHATTNRHCARLLFFCFVWVLSLVFRMLFRFYLGLDLFSSGPMNDARSDSSAQFLYYVFLSCMFVLVVFAAAPAFVASVLASWCLITSSSSGAFAFFCRYKSYAFFVLFFVPSFTPLSSPGEIRVVRPLTHCIFGVVPSFAGTFSPPPFRLLTLWR